MLKTDMKCIRPPRYLNLDDKMFVEQFPEELLIQSLDDSPANRSITLCQLGLEEEDVIIREHNKVYFYFRRKRE